MSISHRLLPLIPAFHAVMDTGSLSAAARRLQQAQPTVRRHIEALEADLGATLFTRGANGLTPTAMGHSLMPLAAALLEEAAALSRVASAEVDRLEGVVRITCSRVAATHVMPRILAQLARDTPGLRFELAATDRTEDLTRRAADIALRFVAPRQQALRAVRLPDVMVGLFGAPGRDWSAGVADFAKLPLISDDREDLIMRALTEAGLPKVSRPILRCDDPLAQIAHIQAGLGVGICQVKLAERLGLVGVLPTFRHAMPAWLVVHEDQARIARIRLVLDTLRHQLPRMM